MSPPNSWASSAVLTAVGAAAARMSEAEASFENPIFQEHCRRLTIHLPGGSQNSTTLPASWRHWQTGPRHATVIETAWNDMDDALEKVHACQPGATGMEAASLSLKEIYQAYLRPSSP